MKKLLTSFAVLTIGSAVNAQPVPPIADGFKAGGEVLLTFGNTHYSDSDVLAAGKLTFEGAAPIGDVRATVRGEVNLRSDLQALPSDMDDPYNIDAALETNFGKFGYTTNHRCAGVGFPWTDGDVGNLGSANIHPWVPPTFRCAGGLSVYFGEGGLAADDHFYYSHKIGGFGVNAWYDPDLNYDGVDRTGVANIDGEDSPVWEAEVTYDAKVAQFLAATNDVGDKKLKLSAPVGQTGLNLAYEYNQLNGGLQFEGHILTAMYFGKPGSLLRLARIDVYDVSNELDETFENWMADVRFGQGPWELGLGMDGQGNYAAEGAYKLRDNLSIVAGFDSGFETGDGWSAAAAGPATSIEGRDESYEIGLKLTF